MEERIQKALEESVKVKQGFVRESGGALIQVAERISQAFTSDRKLLICGNGGSAADAQHLAAEFVNRFVLERPPLPAVALTTDTSILTSIGNDYSFDEIFSKQVKAIGKEGDILLAISTSGDSPNVTEAVRVGREMGLYTVAMTGGDGGTLRRIADLSLVVKSKVTARIQETHIFAGHIICQLVDEILFMTK
ncbi:MAG: D-sedoheptulose-7-phosphate isomerase [Thermodesulfobacteriota bacterium]